ncbi:MAG TPA: DUF222 domain-containing protein, partial [Microbacterium sp.]|nr:DUF222 domain-containing protein [Microbacterium sp.]
MGEHVSQASSVVSDLDVLVGHLSGVRARAANAFAAETFFFAEVALVVQRRDRERAARAGTGARVEATQLGMREVYAEVATALHLSELQVARRVAAAVLLCEFEETLYRVSDGVLSPQHAQVIADTGTVIEDRGVRAEYERHALAIADELTPAQLRDALAGLVSRLDPDGTRERIRDAVTRRQVTVRPLEPGLSRVTADVPTVQGVGIVNRLRDIATELHQQNQADAEAAGAAADAGSPGETGTEPDAAPADERTHSQVMADVFCDLLLTGTPDGHGTTEHNRAVLAAIRPTVQVTIPAGTLTAPARTAATLTGGTFTGPGNACPATGPDGTGRIVGTVGAGYGLAEIPGYGPV